MTILYSDNAQGSLSVASETHTLVLNEGEGVLFPVIENPLDFFYVRIGTDANHQVAKVTARSTETLTTKEDVAGYPIATPVKLTVCTSLLDNFQKCMFGNKTYIIGGDTPDFATFTDFANAFIDSDERIDDTHTVDLFLNGVLNETISDSGFINPERIQIHGSSANVTITSVQSSSGSVGNYSVVLNLTSVAGLVIDQVLLVYDGQLTGGTHPEYLIGAHRITNVDEPNNRITVHSDYPAVSSGAITGEVTVLLTVVNKIELNYGGFKLIENIAINVESESEDTAFTIGYPLVFNSSISNIAITSALIGLLLDTGSIINVGMMISGCATGALISSGTIRSLLSFSGCDQAMDVQSGDVNSYIFCYGCTEGLHVSLGSRAVLDSPAFVDTTNTAIKASRYGYIKVITPTLTNNGTDYSPSLNTQGNKYGYIDDGT